MSLINQMLRDLERRGDGAALGVSAVGGLVAVDGAPSEAQRTWYLLPVLAGLGMGVGVYLGSLELGDPRWLAGIVPPSQVPANAAARAPGPEVEPGAPAGARQPLLAESPELEPSPPPTDGKPQAPARPAVPPARSSPAQTRFALRLTDDLGLLALAGPGDAVFEAELQDEARRLNALLFEAPSAALAPRPSVAPQAPPARGPRGGKLSAVAPIAPESAPVDDASPVRVERVPVILDDPARRAEDEYGRALGALRMGRERTAEEHLRTALEAVPGHPGAREALALALVRRGDLDGAAAVLAEHGSTPRLVMLAARVELERGRLEAALAILAQSRSAGVESPELLAFRAALLQRAGRHAVAVDVYRSVVSSRGGNAVWWMGLGISLEAIGEAGEARAAFARAAELGGLAPQVARFVEGRLIALDPAR